MDNLMTVGARARPTWCQAYRPLIDLVLEYNFLKGIDLRLER